MNKIAGFSKLSKEEKINWLKTQLPQAFSLDILPDFWLANPVTQKQIEEFSENTIGNFVLPFGVAPNFMINQNLYSIPFVTEESSVVAAAARSGKFWMQRGGFQAEVISTSKNGQVHFFWEGDKQNLFDFFGKVRTQLLEQLKPITRNMDKRGGGIRSIELVDCTAKLANYFQIFVTFETCDAMGANFINSVLEDLGARFKAAVSESPVIDGEVDINLCILSNYTPECLVRAKVICPISDLVGVKKDMPAEVFAERFKRAVDIARVDIRRAVTHNKGIFNGIDAVVLATGNDFRAIEACGHAYAARDGQYRGLTQCELHDGLFEFSLEIPLAIGTVGGLTSLHPMARVSLEMLGAPNAKALMQIVAVAGLAQNFGALRSLVTTGIQQGHMKMHLLNILNHLKATESEIKSAKIYFTDKAVSFAAVREFLNKSKSVH